MPVDVVLSEVRRLFRDVFERGLVEPAPVWENEEVHTVEFEEDGRATGRTVARHSCKHAARLLGNALCESPFVPHLVDVLTADSSLLGGVLQQQDRDAAESRVRDVVVPCIARQYAEGLQGILKWDLQVFDDVARALASDLSISAERMSFVAPLDGFSMDADQLQLRPDLSISRFSNDEKRAFFENFAKHAPWSAGPAIHELLAWQFAVRYAAKAPRITYWLNDRPHDFVVEALRLTGRGSVASLNYWWTGQRDLIVSAVGGRMHQASPVPGGDYRLVVEHDTGEKLGELVSLLEQERTDQVLAVSRRRLAFAYNRRNPEDKVVDYWIGLEALFTTKDERTEIVDRLSRRIALLCANGLTERREMRQRTKKLYDLRSSVIHGGVLRSHDEEKLPEDAEDVADLLRTAIRRRLKPGWSIEDLEDQMLSC